jgi:hypothetical protein
MAQALPVVGTSVSDPTRSFNQLTALLGIVVIFYLLGKAKKVVGL